jgi:hypothetical protein
LHRAAGRRHCAWSGAVLDPLDDRRQQIERPKSIGRHRLAFRLPYRQLGAFGLLIMNPPL